MLEQFGGAPDMTSTVVVVLTSPVKYMLFPATTAVRRRYPALAMMDVLEGEVKLLIGAGDGTSIGK